MHKRKESTSDIHQLLQYVEKKFSDVLIPANQLVTQEYLGKGTYVCLYLQSYLIMNTIIFICTGAFGLVHRGTLNGLDGTMITVAIKTIKCE